jgi:cytochrome c
MKISLFAFLAISASLLSMPALADGDASAGANLFKKKCHVCHSIGPDAKNKVGPELNGIIGKEIGSNPEFKYSKALLEKKSEGVVWNAETLDQWLEKPRDFIKGTKMGYAGDKNAQERQDIIAYVETFSD